MKSVVRVAGIAHKAALGLACAVTLTGYQCALARGPAPARLDVLQIQPNFYVIAGAGANIGVQTGPHGVLLVNAGTQQGAPEVLAEIAKLTPPSQPIRFIIDTSADGDVLGGNGKLAAAGRSMTTAWTKSAGNKNDEAMTFSHAEVVARLSDPPDSKHAHSIEPEAWPKESFSEKRRTMYFNDEGIEIIHLPAAHTDGDVLVFFRKSDVIVAGNVIDADGFPLLDLAHGGSIQGEINALNRIIEIAIPPGPYFSDANVTDMEPGGTAVVPGHGHVFRQIDVVNYRDMVLMVRDAVQDLIDQHMTLDQIQAADPAKPYTTRYGATSGSWTTKMFIEAVYVSLTIKH